MRGRTGRGFYLNFNRWLEATVAGDGEVTDLYERRFRNEFRPAFEAWLANDPLDNADAIPSPLREQDYKLANTEKASKLERVGDLALRRRQGGH